MDFTAMRDLIENGIPFHRLLGIRVAELAEGKARLFIPFRPEIIGDSRRPALHGGVISTLADVCAGFAVWTRCRLEDRIATIDLSVDYLRPATASDLYAEAEVRLLGNRVGNARVVLWSADAPGVHVAEGRGVYNIRRGKTGAGQEEAARQA
jgi:uncharacterized protein (TIGR00369 family)